MKKRQVVLYIVVMLMLITTAVYATISAELSFKFVSSGEKFCAGDEFTTTLELKNINSAEGIKSIEGYIDIDENVLENLTVASIVTGEDGKVKINDDNILPVYDADNIGTDTGIVLNTEPISNKGDYKIVINLSSPIKTDTDLVTIKFKIKEGVEPGIHRTVMSYKLFTIFEDDAGEKVQLADKSFKIEVSDRNGSNGNTTNNPISSDENNTNTPANTPVNNTVNPTNNTAASTNNTAKAPVNNAQKQPANKAGNGNTQTGRPDGKNPTNPGGSGTSQQPQATQQKNDGTLAPTNLPKTGYRLILIPIIVMSIVGIVFYKKYSKYNNYHE